MGSGFPDRTGEDVFIKRGDQSEREGIISRARDLGPEAQTPLFGPGWKSFPPPNKGHPFASRLRSGERARQIQQGLGLARRTAPQAW